MKELNSVSFVCTFLLLSHISLLFHPLFNLITVSKLHVALEFIVFILLHVCMCILKHGLLKC